MATIKLLNDLKAAHGGVSDYRIAKILGIKPQTIYSWKSGKSYMSDEVGIRAAEELGIDPKKVIIDLHIERESGNATSPVWKAIREQLNTAAALAVAGFVGYGLALFGAPPLV